jgi:hypothetical protein
MPAIYRDLSLKSISALTNLHLKASISGICAITDTTFYTGTCVNLIVLPLHLVVEFKSFVCTMKQLSANPKSNFVQNLQLGNLECRLIRIILYIKAKLNQYSDR